MSARAADPMRFDTFNSGDHLGAFRNRRGAEAICKFLYPNDTTLTGRELRLASGIFLRLRPRCRIWFTATSRRTGICIFSLLAPPFN
jgi:hypothetical protein